jgi:hypothetical protein
MHLAVFWGESTGVHWSPYGFWGGLQSTEYLCNTLKCSSFWDDFCECENGVLKFTILSSHDVCSTLKCSQIGKNFTNVKMI